MLKLKNTPIVLILFLSFCCTGFFEITYGQETQTDYYMVDGQKIDLQISSKYSAIKLKEGMSATEIRSFSASIDTTEFGKIETSPILENLGILLVRIKEGAVPSTFRTAVENLRGSSEVEPGDPVPVYEVGGIDQVLVNEFIVQFKSDVSEANIQQFIQNTNAEVVQKNEKINNRYTIKFTGKSPREALTICNENYQNPLIDFLEPNFIRIYPQRPRIEGDGMGARGASAPSPSATPNDPLYPNQWGLNNTGATGVSDADIDAPEAWDITKGSNTIIIAIIDEGVDTDHPDLSSKIVTPYDAIDGDNNQEPNSWDGHGTACAGIAAALTHNSEGVSGVGWEVKIMPIRIAHSNSPDGDWITSNLIIEDGIRTAVDRGAKILSNSWGGGSPSSAINSAIDYAITNDCVVVFAAGNCRVSGSNACPQPVIYPANLSLSKVIIAVSATNEWDQFKTPTSSDGENWWGSHNGPEVTLSAPGVHVYTTDISGSGGYSSNNYVSNFNGTSSATPFVAGAAALVLSQNNTWSPNQVRTQLQNTADDLGPPGFDNKFGYGRLNVCVALGGSCVYGVAPPASCATIGFPIKLFDTNFTQTLVNTVLLFSTVLVFLLILILQTMKRIIKV